MEVSGSAIDQLVQDNAFYRYATILGGSIGDFYRGFLRRQRRAAGNIING